MRRLMRWIGRAGVITSAVMCVLLTGIWVRCWFGGNWITYLSRPAMNEQLIVLGWNERLVMLMALPRDANVSLRQWYGGGNWRFMSNLRSDQWRPILDAQPGFWGRHGFVQLSASTGLSKRTMTGYLVPIWFVWIVASVPVAWWIVLYRARKKLGRWAELGLCVNCGYDLRESPERCPECGTLRTPAKSATAAAG